MDELVVTVFDADNNDVTANSQVLIGNSPITGNRFKTVDVGNFTAKATLNGKETNPVTFKAIRHEVNNFSKKIILEEFAGMWCSYCTKFTYLIDTSVKRNNKIIPVSIHSADPLEYIYEKEMRKKFGIFDFPSGYVNRATFWDQSAVMLQNDLNWKSKCGLALNTAINNKSINITVKVKFDVTTSENLNIVVLLLEDSLVYQQANIYDSSPGSPFFGLGNPILHYTHNNVLRAAATDIFGDPIPGTVQNKNETWEKAYAIDATGYNISNCRIVAFVQYAQNNVSRWGALNAQSVKAGSNIWFD
ncbi:MAG: hypothetical protein NVS3B19_20600 [Ginsengibacter sp.]